MKILFLGNKDNNVYKFLTSSAFVTKIFSTEKKVSPDQIAMYDFVISFTFVKSSYVFASADLRICSSCLAFCQEVGRVHRRC